MTPLCLGLHLEGPFLNPDAAGAIPVDELTPVDLDALEDWLASGLVRLVTISPGASPGALEAIAARRRARGGRGGRAHARERYTTASGLDAGARFATHLWNAMAPVRARTTGPGSRAPPRRARRPRPDRRRAAPPPAHRGAHRSRCGPRADRAHERPRAGRPRSAQTGRCSAATAAAPRSSAAWRASASPRRRRWRALCPPASLGLADRGRIAPGYRADLAVLARGLRAARDARRRFEDLYACAILDVQLDELPPSTRAPESGA